ncbi:hypothetical protein F8O01_00330 [Pseudoclavibacter chungangensis]|uniref:Trypsin-like serine protease n=1 Tax=Pseudoclavibacter chungangensis TaxID=587635 RepID=A0A7J5C1E6_9MICO|nr:hypothetical protein [Pseudoclavibacter chungangensis]KAB1662434.1 hypothetical protein F8O01_00330 [Pseudoclavibacter chungangensis]NYJ68462.1 V8-like Glu-specific endopeptidase [Pseudoclavibacter chungangensis]
MTDTHRRAMTAIAVLFLVPTLTACVSVTATPAAGGYQPYAPAVVSEEVALRDTFDSSAPETHDYWSNPDMFADADGMNFTDPDNGITVGASDPATGAYFPPTTPTPAAESTNGYGDIAQAQQYDRGGLGASTFGRLYMAFNGHNGVCSATVVNSSRGDIVVTAAHCLMDLSGDRSTPQNVVFVPGDAGNAQTQPYGQWAAVEYLMPQNFVDNAHVEASGSVTGAGWTTDFAFLIMEEKNGQSIQDVTGGQGISFGVPVQAITQIGYPTAEPFDGTDEFVCASTSWTQSFAGGYSHPCDMTPGCSGGGWLAYFDRTLGAGYIIATTSTVSLSGTPTTSGSPLGKQALELYEQADAKQ